MQSDASNTAAAPCIVGVLHAKCKKCAGNNALHSINRRLQPTIRRDQRCQYMQALGKPLLQYAFVASCMPAYHALLTSTHTLLLSCYRPYVGNACCRPAAMSTIDQKQHTHNSQHCHLHVACASTATARQSYATYQDGCNPVLP